MKKAASSGERAALFLLGTPWLARCQTYPRQQSLLHTASVFPREGGDPDWAPAFAGEQGTVLDLNQPYHHPGEGRGPLGKRCQLRTALRYCHLPNWAPASAGVAPSLQTFPSDGAPREPSFLHHASHGRSPCRRPRLAAPAGLGRVLRQLGAGRPAPYLGRGPPNGSGGVGRRSRRGSCAWYAWPQ